MPTGRCISDFALFACDTGQVCGGKPFAHAGFALGNVDALDTGALSGRHLLQRLSVTLEDERDAR